MAAFSSLLSHRSSAKETSAGGPVVFVSHKDGKISWQTCLLCFQKDPPQKETSAGGETAANWLGVFVSHKDPPKKKTSAGIQHQISGLVVFVTTMLNKC